jgi:vacuolar-type H+-ATPase catalytic subunit A/Vma1
MLKAMMDFYRRTQDALEVGTPLAKILALPVIADIARMKEYPVDQAEIKIRALMDRIRFSFDEFGVRDHV